MRHIAGKTEYKNQWLTENKERINLVVDKGKKDAIKSHSLKSDKGSINKFINRAIDETIERDTKKADE